MLGELESDVQHAQAVERHPASGISLLEGAASRQWIRTIEQSNVVQPEEAAFEHVLAVIVLSVGPPGKVHQQLLEDTFQKIKVLTTVHLALDLESPEGRPCVHRRIDIAKVPLVRRQLSVRVHVPLASEEVKLLLGKVRVDHGDGYAVESRVPSGEERILP